MYADVAGRPHSLALRPAQDAYRSMPGTPLGMEPQGANAVDLAAAMNHARMGLDGQDYFLGAQRFPPGIMRSRPPMPPGMGNDWNHENAQMNRSMGNMLPYQERDRERDLEDQTRKCVVRLPLQRHQLTLHVETTELPLYSTEPYLPLPNSLKYILYGAMTALILRTFNFPRLWKP